jgi:cell division protein FtsB
VKKRRQPAALDSGPASPRRRRQRVVKYVLTLVGCVVLVDALVGDKGLLELMKARQQHQNLEAFLLQARTENARLREEARRLREDPAAIEELARREHGLIRPGELLFIVKDVDQAPR